MRGPCFAGSPSAQAMHLDAVAAAGHLGNLAGKRHLRLLELSLSQPMLDREELSVPGAACCLLHAELGSRQLGPLRLLCLLSEAEFPLRCWGLGCRPGALWYAGVGSVVGPGPFPGTMVQCWGLHAAEAEVTHILLCPKGHSRDNGSQPTVPHLFTYILHTGTPLQ